MLRLRFSVAPAGGRDNFCWINTGNRGPSKAEHRVKLTEEEEGAEDEDVTNLQSLPEYFLPMLCFNRPFQLLIFEKGSCNLPFMGKVMNPKAKSPSGDKSSHLLAPSPNPPSAVQCLGLLKKKENSSWSSLAQHTTYGSILWSLHKSPVSDSPISQINKPRSAVTQMTSQTHSLL
ncbi:hypothetical protein P7K49_018534 [Saguinus oedipus]|uniref:Serpin domain-containing protein n=1 Tax=Saguinus oedipus TaxID=9490 RepID=A0ABQ9V7N5_SAGOE|nr:hypothetical protein P7K49_018534 [Saguinus oedipus]